VHDADVRWGGLPPKVFVLTMRDERGQVLREGPVENRKEAVAEFLARDDGEGSAAVLEATQNWRSGPDSIHGGQVRSLGRLARIGSSELSGQSSPKRKFGEKILPNFVAPVTRFDSWRSNQVGAPCVSPKLGSVNETF
jgi:hypothetical protein